MALPTIKNCNFMLINLYRHRPRFCSSSPHPDHTIIAHNLISIFTKHQYPDNAAIDHPQLEALAPKLTPQIVESVLGGLRSWRRACDFFAWASDQHRHGYAHNCYTYNALATVLSGARRNAQLRLLASDLVDSRCSMSPGALGFFIRCLGLVGLCQDANFLFDRVRSEGLCVPNSYTYNCLLEALSKCSGSVHVVEMRFNEMRESGFGFDKYTLTPLLNVYCSEGQFEKAMGVFNEMCERGWVDSRVLSILVVSFSKCGKVDDAMELIQRVEGEFGVCLNEKTFCALIHGFVKEHRVDMALRLLHKMEESGFTPHVSVFDVIVSELCRNREFEKVLSLYLEMKRLGVRPDVEVFSKLVSSFPEEVLLFEFPQGMDAKDLILLYNSMVVSLVDDGLVDRAYSLLQAMIGDGDVEKANLVKEMVHPDTDSFRIVIDGLLKTNKLDTALCLFKNMIRIGCEPNVLLYNNLIDGLCSVNRVQKVDQALELFNDICALGYCPDVIAYNVLINGLCKARRVSEAHGLLNQMVAKGLVPSVSTFNSLIHGFVKEHRVEMALRLLHKMEESGFTPHVSVFDVIISELCGNREFEKVLSLYLEMKRLGVRPDVGVFSKLVSSFPEEVLLFEFPQGMDAKDLILLYNSMMVSLVDDGLVDRAYSLLQAMIGDGDVEKANLVKEIVHPDTDSFRIVIDGLLKTNKLDTALCLFEDMIRIGCEPNVLLYNNLIDGLCSVNRVQESYELLRKMKESGFEPTQFTHNAIFGCLCKERDAASALGLVKAMRVYGHQPWIKHTILLVKELSGHGKVMEACEFLDGMVREGFLPDLIAYSTAVNGLVKIRKIDQALELFNDICALGYCPDVIAYNVLINGLCKARRASEAHGLLNQMVAKGLVPSVSTYNSLIDCSCKNGDVDRALTCLSTMSGKQREPNAISYTTLIDGLCSSGRPDDALSLWSEMAEKGCPPNRIAYMALVHGLCKCGRPDAGLVYFREMEEKNMEPETYVYVALIASFVSHLKQPLALEILKEMVDKGKFPNPLDKHYATVKDVIHKLLEDERTSLDVKELITEGSIPSMTSF